MKKEDYIKWVDKAYQYIEDVYSQVCQIEEVNVGSTQYIPKIDGDIKLVFLGHDAHEGRGYGEPLNISNAKERFFKGNGDPRYWRQDNRWKIWKNIESAFSKIGFDEIMDDDNKYISEEILKETIITNALLFNYSKADAKELNKCLKADIVNECMKLTGELIFDVIKPKMVICLSCPLVFEPLINNYKKNNNADISYSIIRLKETSKRVMKCVYNDITVLGIPHTSYPVPLSVAKFVRDTYLDNDICYTSQIDSTHLKNNPSIAPMHNKEKERVVEIKKMVPNNGAIQRIFDGIILYHEYFTIVQNGKYLKTQDRIVIDLAPEEDNNQYVVLVFTRQNDEKKTRELVQEIWPNEDFKPWDKDHSRHVHKVIPFNESNENIAEILTQTLKEIKAYRNKTYPLHK